MQYKSVGRTHRLGRPGKQRPVIIYFQDFNEKKLVFKNAYKLKGTRITPQIDCSRSTLNKRRRLWNSAKAEEEQGKKVSLINDKLRVNNKFFIWDQQENSRTQIRGNQGTPKND